MTRDEKPGISILIADDHPMVREGLRSMLNAPGLDIVGEASNGHEAVEQVKALAPDIVLMDIRMPDMDGIEALRAIKRTHAPARVIMITTYQSTAYLLRALAAGAAGFVLKDISRDALLATVRAVAAGTTSVDHQFLQRALRDLSEVSELSVEGETIDPLTPREMDVLWLIAEGLTNSAIAHALGLSPTTVKSYVQIILQKLNATDRTHAAVKAIRMGLVK
ncbi:MAG: response regulator transcription factor [Anaerolineae bacterium]|nr:response regulator transcription factor [Anaerolineae bacterium]